MGRGLGPGASLAHTIVACAALPTASRTSMTSVADKFGWWDTKPYGTVAVAQPDTHSNPANANTDTIRAGDPAIMGV